MKVAVFYIATGRYITFFEGLYNSAKKYFLNGHDKTFFVFTDNNKFPCSDKDDVIIVPQEHLPWPYSTLLRYDMFLKVEEQLKDYDFCYYINANCEFKKEVGEEIFPTEKQGLVATIWADQYYEEPDDYPYCRNEKSNAYIPYGVGKNYYMGGFNGGRVKDFIEMSKEISRMTAEDIKNDQIPEFHDQSMINKYLLNRDILVLEPNYCYPAKWKIKPFCNDVKLEIVKKHHYKYGGHAYLRGETDKKITPIKYFLNKLFKLNLK